MMLAELIAPAREKVLLIDLLEKYVEYLRYERDLAATTVMAYRSDLRRLSQFVGDKDVAEINRDDFRGYIRMLIKQGYKANTVRRMMHGFGTLWTWLQMEKYVTEIVTQHVQLPRKNVVQPRWMDESDLRAFVAACEQVNNEPFAVGFLLMAFTGMRPVEIRALRVINLNLESCSLTVRNTKSRRDRVLPIPEHLVGRLAKLIEGRYPSNYVFGGDGIHPWHRQTMHNYFNQVQNLAGLKDFTMYSLRHSVGTLFALNAVAPQVIRDYLGHANITTTSKYLHAAGLDLKQALKQHPLISK